jgi:ATP-dependent helicase/nuclease subunit B
LENLGLAFADDRLTCREWVPILEAGLSRLTVGLIPPALDQVLVGAIDRSRNVEAKLVIVLGINETVFPAQPEQSVLLTESDRCALEELDLAPGGTSRHHAGRERHLAYLAFTRAKERLIVSNCLHDLDGMPLNPSPFLTHLRVIFPGLSSESLSQLEPEQPEHPHEMVLPVLKTIQSGATIDLDALREKSPALSDRIEHALATIQPMNQALGPENIDAELASKLYGPVLKTSVSRLEQFAACPFRFFVHSGLDAKERTRFELDARERGNFQHEVLAEFHNHVAREGKRWRDLTPQAARTLVRTIATELSTKYRDGLLFKDEIAEFSTILVTEALEDFVETMVEWMHSQYQFDPAAAELGFGEGENCPPWELALEGGARLQLQGRIDRIDLHRPDSDGNGSCVIIDYKSSPKKLDPVFIQHGIQLQLLSYLNVMRRVPKLRELFGLRKLDPAGVFYVSLRGKYSGERNRSEALEGTSQERKMAYKHAGRFDLNFLRILDSRDEKSGDQISYRLKMDGQPYSSSVEAVESTAFTGLLKQVEMNLKDMGKRIYEGETAIAPYRKGSETACDHCDYRSICRSDPWTQKYRSLKKADI